MKNKFPRDIFIVSGAPLIAMAVLVSGVFSLQGAVWVAAYGLGLLMSLAGALLILKAKLPAYRSRRFLTVGGGNLPEHCRSVYRSGVLASCAGFLLCLLLLIGSRTWR